MSLSCSVSLLVLHIIICSVCYVYLLVKCRVGAVIIQVFLVSDGDIVTVTVLTFLSVLLDESVR